MLYKYRSIIELLENSLKKNPTKVAVISNLREYTYAYIEEKSNIIAQNLLEMGGRNELFAIMLDKSIEFITSVIAIWKIGGTYIPIDRELPTERIKYIMNDSNAKYAIVKEKINFIESDVKTLSIEEIVKERSVKINLTDDYIINNNKIAYIIYTSGSTGKPKGVQVTNNNLLSFFDAITERLNLKNDERFLSVTTVSFDISILEMFLPLINGGTLIIGNKRMLIDMEYLKKAIEKFTITILQATPLTWNLLINSNWKNENNVKILCGGEKLEEKLSKKLYKMSNEVWNLYGPTETTIWSSAHKLEYAGDTSIGTPLKNNKFYLFTEDMKKICNEGELYIGGESVSHGYVNKDEITKEKFIKNPFNENEIIYKTGDIVKYKNKKYYCLGRTDFQVKMNGHRIELEEIEKNIEKIDNIDHAVAIAEQNSKVIYGFVTIKDERIIFNEEDIKKDLEKFLPNYMIPRRIILVDFFPMTFNNKIDRKKIIEQMMSSKEENNNKLQTITKIWEDVLKQQVDIHTPYFEYQCDSLMITELCIRMEEVYNKFSFYDLIEYKTIDSIVENFKKKSNSTKELYGNNRLNKMIKQYNLTLSGTRFEKINEMEQMMLNYSMVMNDSINFKDVYFFKVPYRNVKEIRNVFFNIMEENKNLKTLYVFGENIKIYSDQLNNMIQFEYKDILCEEELKEYIKQLTECRYKINDIAIKLNVITYNDDIYWVFSYPHIRLDEVAFFKLVDKILKKIDIEEKMEKPKIVKKQIKIDNNIKVTLSTRKKNSLEIKALKDKVSIKDEIEYSIINILLEMNVISNDNYVNYVVNLPRSIGNNISVYSIILDKVKNIEEYIKRKKYMQKKKENRILFSYNNIKELSFDEKEIDFFHKENNDFDINVEIYDRKEKIDIIISTKDEETIELIKLKEKIKNL